MLSKGSKESMLRSSLVGRQATTLMMESDDKVNEEALGVTRFSKNRACLNTLGTMAKLQYVF